MGDMKARREHLRYSSIQFCWSSGHRIRVKSRTPSKHLANRPDRAQRADRMLCKQEAWVPCWHDDMVPWAKLGDIPKHQSCTPKTKKSNQKSKYINLKLETLGPLAHICPTFVPNDCQLCCVPQPHHGSASNKETNNAVFLHFLSSYFATL